MLRKLIIMGRHLARHEWENANTYSSCAGVAEMNDPDNEHTFSILLFVVLNSDVQQDSDHMN